MVTASGTPVSCRTLGGPAPAASSDRRTAAERVPGREVGGTVESFWLVLMRT